MTREDRASLIAKYAAGYDEVVRALRGFPEELIAHHPFPGKWSAREIVHHLADSETISGQRLRRLLSEEYPVIVGYDQDTWAILLRYNLRDHRPSLEAFRYARETSLQLLEQMGEDDWQRSGWHTESGLYTATTWLRIYAAHAHDHAAQIARLKDALTAKG
uniref:DinB-like domain-containing protein n=1 Tax=Eiseniibacteriota bacterium TaxID=2212470 RepID=A0A832I173_UNCEI